MARGTLGPLLFSPYQKATPMGQDDRDWYRDVQREREKQAQMDATRSRFSRFSQRQLPAKPVSPFKTGMLPMLVFWCAIMGALYWGMTHYLKPKQAQVQANGDLVIPRAADGHFYVAGTVNGQPVDFLVDTGASLVSVTEAFAKRAGIEGGTSATFQTANGNRAGRIVPGVDIAVGPVRVSSVRVGVGLTGMDDGQALLGQSFLSRFDIALQKDQMVLQAR
jgi:aspartyl protease family protein